MFHFEGGKAEFPYPSYESAFFRDLTPVLYAAGPEKSPGGKYDDGEMGGEGADRGSGKADTKEYVTPLRILSVIAMSISLVCI